MRHVLQELAKNPDAFALATAGAGKGIYEVYLRPNMSPAIGWGMVGATALAWDILAPQTLTSGVREAFKRHPLAVTSLMGAIAVHLVDPKYSPLDFIYDVFKGIK